MYFQSCTLETHSALTVEEGLPTSEQASVKTPHCSLMLKATRASSNAVFADV